jgi:transglutaminase-like putative cysteine protease
MYSDDNSLDLDITVRVGCSLTYEVSGSASLLLNLKLAPDPRRSVLFEALSLGDDLRSEEFEDSHGNLVHRVTLQPGTNCFRQDALVAVSSKPDNFNLIPGKPEAIGDVPVQLLRYTLPSRYCDSDKLANFAWDKFGHVEHGWSRVQAISRWIHQNIEY